jgi:benzoylformate decarboxylase
MKIAEFLLQSLERAGVRRIFGNPGTTEIPLVRACEKRDTLRYVVALSEVAAVPMADGYARATRSLGVVNLHVAPGLGNGMGALYTAGIAKTPLLVLIGGQDRRFLHTGPILYGPIESMAQSVCKQVFRLDAKHDAAANVRNAIRAALSTPFGPVALVCPPDLLEEEIDSVTTQVTPIRLGGLENTDAHRIADFLRSAKNPAIIATEDVHWHSASPALRALAETIAAPVYAAPYTGVLPIDAASRAFAGYLTPSMAGISDRLAKHDALLFVGGRTLRTTLFSEAKLTQPKIWIGDDPQAMPAGDEYGTCHLVDLRQGLSAIRMAAGSIHWRGSNLDAQARAAVPLPEHDASAFHPTLAIHALLAAFADALIVDEAGLSTSDVRQWMQTSAGEYLINGSGGIGWGLAAAVGAAVGRRDRRVVCIVGDGSSLYASEALWSAANQSTNLVVVVLSNGRYSTLNAAAKKLTGHELDLFSIEPPRIDFSGLANLYGLAFARARTESELADALASARTGGTGNMLLELVFDPALVPVTASRHF